MDDLLITLWRTPLTRLPIIFGLIGTIICATTPFDFLIIIGQFIWLGYYIMFVLFSTDRGDFEVNIAGLIIHLIFCAICYYIPDLI